MATGDGAGRGREGRVAAGCARAHKPGLFAVSPAPGEPGHHTVDDTHTRARTTFLRREKTRLWIVSDSLNLPSMTFEPSSLGHRNPCISSCARGRRGGSCCSGHGSRAVPRLTRRRWGRRRQRFSRTDFKHSMGDVVVVVVASASIHQQRACCWGATAGAAAGAAAAGLRRAALRLRRGRRVRGAGQDLAGRELHSRHAHAQLF